MSTSTSAARTSGRSRGRPAMSRHQSAGRLTPSGRSARRSATTRACRSGCGKSTAVQRTARGSRSIPPLPASARTLSVDEGFHEGVFREITRVYLRFWPEKALQAIWDVYEKYRMPIVKLPNAEAFIAAVLSTGIDSHRAVITEILNPTYASLGFESRAAVKRAARESWDLPEGSVLLIGDEVPDYISEGTVPYK